MTIRIEQWYRHASQRYDLDPAFCPVDHADTAIGPWSSYAKLHQAYSEQRYRQAEYTGCVSGSFQAQTGLSGQHLLNHIANHPGFDVYFINPDLEAACQYRSPWARLNALCPEAAVLAQHIFTAVGQPLELATLTIPSAQIAYGDFWIAKGAFWQSFMAYSEPFYRYLQKELTPEQRALLEWGDGDIFMQALFSTFLATVGAEFSRCPYRYRMDELIGRYGLDQALLYYKQLYYTW